MIVIGVSAFAKYLLTEEGWREVGRYLRERRLLLTLDLALKEAANALWKHCRLRGAIDPATAVKVFRGLVRLVETGAVEVEDESGYLTHALEIALNTAYPCTTPSTPPKPSSTANSSPATRSKPRWLASST